MIRLETQAWGFVLDELSFYVAVGSRSSNTRSLYMLSCDQKTILDCDRSGLLHGFAEEFLGRM